MKFEDAVLTLVKDSQRTGAIRMRKHAKRSPLLWKALENRIRHDYEEANGSKLPAKVDWETLLSFLKDKLPMILELVVKLFS